jgi:predicted metal-dependent hydrolase
MEKQAKPLFNEELLTALAKEQHYTEKDYERITKQRVEAAVKEYSKKLKATTDNLKKLNRQTQQGIKNLSGVLPVSEIARFFDMSENEIEEILNNS